MQIKKFKLWQETQLQQHPKNNKYHRRFNWKWFAILIILNNIKNLNMRKAKKKSTHNG